MYMKKKISLQGTATEINIQSLTSDLISFAIGGVGYSFNVVHRFDNRRMVLRSIETGQQFLASVGVPTKSGTTTIQLRNNDIIIKPITRSSQESQNAGESDPNAVAPLSGIIRAIKVKKGDAVTEGMTVAIIEAMKMQMPIEANTAGVIVDIHVKENDEVREGALLVEISR